MTNDNFPGVVFYMNNTQVLASSKGLERVKVVLVAEIRDAQVWKEVAPKLDGLKIYTADDFKGEMLNALREEHLKLEAEKKRLEKELAASNEKVEQMTSALSVLHRQIEG